MCSYLYLPRLRDRDVLLRAIEEGGISTVVASPEFAYAEGYNEEASQYVGLRIGGGGSVVMDLRSLLVKPEVARKQIEEEEPEDTIVDPPPPVNRPLPPQETTKERLPKRFYASITLDPERVGRDAGRVADEVLSQLSALPGANVKVTVEIETETPEGVPEHVQRTVSENAGVLKFDLHGFERE
jgi:hypothetical protein